MNKISPQLEEELRQLKDGDNLIPMSEVNGVVRSVVKSLPWDKIIKTLEKSQQVENPASVQKAIHDLDIMSVRDFLLPSVERELAAIMEALQTATHRILENVEQIEKDEDISKKMENRVSITHIYEACTFQDITGQRMNKIILLLKKLEIRIEGLLGRGGDLAASERYAKMVTKQQAADETLTGPNSGSLTSSQKDVDRLFQDQVPE